MNRYPVESPMRQPIWFPNQKRIRKLAPIRTYVDVVGLVDHGKWAHVRVAGKTGYISANLLK